MAVAADSHRDFLIPEHTWVCPTTSVISRLDDLCLFFCNLIISHQNCFFNSKSKILKKRKLPAV